MIQIFIRHFQPFKSSQLAIPSISSTRTLSFAVRTPPLLPHTHPLTLSPPIDVLSLQDPNRGSFSGDSWGEHASRFTYCAVSILSLLGRLEDLEPTREKTIEFIEKCRNFDGGFGMVEGAESHAAYGEQYFLSTHQSAREKETDVVRSIWLSLDLCGNISDIG